MIHIRSLVRPPQAAVLPECGRVNACAGWHDASRNCRGGGELNRSAPALRSAQEGKYSGLLDARNNVTAFGQPCSKMAAFQVGQSHEGAVMKLERRARSTPRPHEWAWVLLAVCLLLPRVAATQDLTGALVGTVKDEIGRASCRERVL